MTTEPVFMDPRKIARELMAPLYDALALVRTEQRIYGRRRGFEEAKRKHRVRSAASKKAWLKIRANKERRKNGDGKP